MCTARFSTVDGPCQEGGPICTVGTAAESSGIVGMTGSSGTVGAAGTSGRLEVPEVPDCPGKPPSFSSTELPTDVSKRSNRYVKKVSYW